MLRAHEKTVTPRPRKTNVCCPAGAAPVHFQAVLEKEKKNKSSFGRRVREGQGRGRVTVDKACSHVVCFQCPCAAQCCPALIGSLSRTAALLPARKRSSGFRHRRETAETLQPKGPISQPVPRSLHRAGRSLRAAAHGRAHGFGRNQVQVLVIRDLVQTVAVLKQLLAQIRMHLSGRVS